MRFFKTDGDLKEMAKALVEAPEMWDAPLTKLKRPNEWLTAMRRTIGGELNVVRSLRSSVRVRNDVVVGSCQS